MGLKIIHNVLAKGGLTIFNLILPLAVMPYIYRVLDPHDLGMIEYATAIVTYFSIFGMLGIYNYGLREMSSIRNNLNSCAFLYRQLFTIGVLSNIFSATCLLLLSFFSAPFWLRTLQLRVCTMSAREPAWLRSSVSCEV